MSKNLPAVVEKREKLQLRMNWFDRLVGWFSPTAFHERQKARLKSNFLTRKYEAADSGRRTDGWNTGSSSANVEVSGSLHKMRNRARDLVRNNPYAARAVQVITNNVVGMGIKTRIKLDNQAGNSAPENELNSVWRAWAETTACDYDGVHTLAGLQRIVMRAVVESGEVFVRVRPMPMRTAVGPDGQEVQLPAFSLQVLESDFVPLTLKQGLIDENGNQIIQGIEIDRQGRRQAYHMYLTHPGGDDVLFSSRFETMRVPADEVMHVYRMDRPGQLRGVPWCHPVVLRLRDLDIFEDAQLKRQQCAAMYAAFVHDVEGIDDAEETKTESELGEKMEPGLIELLPPGKDVKFANPPGAENYKEFVSVFLHSIASGMGLTYEQLTSDLSDVNFSSARMGWLESQRNFDTWQRNIMINQFLWPVFSAFKNELSLLRRVPAGCRAAHTPPKREMIDPAKEIEALKTEVRSGFKTPSEAVSEMGRDPDTHWQEYKQDIDRFDQLDLTLDTDPRRVNNAGTLNEPESSEPPTTETE